MQSRRPDPYISNQRFLLVFIGMGVVILLGLIGVIYAVEQSPAEAPDDDGASVAEPEIGVSGEGATPTGLNGYFITTDGRGGLIGPLACGDYLVPVELGPLPEAASTEARITAALERLFDQDARFVGERELFNPLVDAVLSVDAVTIDAGGVATVELAGELSLIGDCMDAQTIAQIQATAAQFGSPSVMLYLDGRPVDELLAEAAQ